MLAGGRSSEHDVSIASAEAVRGGLAQAGHETVAVEIASDGRWTSEGAPVALEPGGGLLGCDAVFPALHGPYGEDGTVQGLLESLDVPYVGAGVLTSALCMDKVLFKDLMGAAGIAQVDYVGLREGDDVARLAPPRAPGLREARPSRLVGGHLEGLGGRGPAGGARRGVRARPAGDRGGDVGGDGGGVLGAGGRRARGLAAGRDRG